MVESTPIELVPQEKSIEQINTTGVQEEEKSQIPAGTPFPEIVAKLPMPQTMREQFFFAQNLKEEGNFLFKNKDYLGAIKKYSKVRAYLRSLMPNKEGDESTGFINMIGGGGDGDKLTKEEGKQAVQIQAATFLNLAICYFLTQDYKKSVARATESLNLQKTVKAHYRRAKALAEIKDYWGAVADLKEAIKMDPSDPNDFQAELIKFENAAKLKDRASDKKLQGFLLKTKEI